MKTSTFSKSTNRAVSEVERLRGEVEWLRAEKAELAEALNTLLPFAMASELNSHNVKMSATDVMFKSSALAIARAALAKATCDWCHGANIDCPHCGAKAGQP